MLQIAEIFLIAKDGSFIMQHRDDKPGISNPGQITAFGGHIDPGDASPMAAAIREAWEEVRLRIKPEELEDFGYTLKNKAEHGEDAKVYWFVLRNVDIGAVDVREGQGYYLISPEDSLDAINLSKAVKEFITHNLARLS